MSVDGLSAFPRSDAEREKLGEGVRGGDEGMFEPSSKTLNECSGRSWSSSSDTLGELKMVET